ncbi:MAG: DUF4838 domain-containing protein, partial [Betaproteobacteria bacterium HGW-Betaproteobacteria-21]
CNLYFGAAGPALQRYIDLMHEAIAASGDVLSEKNQVDARMFTPEFVIEADRLFDEAERLVADDAVRLKHVLAARMPVDYVVLMRRAEYVVATAGQPWKLDFERRRNRLFDTAKAEQVSQYRQDGKLEELASLIAIERRTAPIPDFVSGAAGTDWVEFQDLGFNRYYDAPIVQDAAASDGAAVRMSGKSAAWSVQFKLDKLPAEGRWDLYMAIRADAGAGDLAKTAVQVGSHPPMNRFVAVPLDGLAKGTYQYVKVPGGPFVREVNHEKGVHVQAVPAAGAEHVFVDRLIAVRIR